MWRKQGLYRVDMREGKVEVQNTTDFMVTTSAIPALQETFSMLLDRQDRLCRPKTQRFCKKARNKKHIEHHMVL